MYKIEKNIPIPERTKKVAEYPINELKVGESFLVPVEPFDDRRAQNRRGNVLLYIRKHNSEGKQFTTSVIDKQGCRCWRIK